MNNVNRKGRVTSSNAHKLIAFGSVQMSKEELKAHKLKFPDSKKRNKPSGFSSKGLTYIEEKQIERRMSNCLDADGAYSQPMAWGSFMEMMVFNKLSVEYEIICKETHLHPVYGDVWSGSTDLLVKGKKIAEIKCYQRKKFALYTDAITKRLTKRFTLKDKLNYLKANFAQEYWQIVSNAVIHGVKIGEAISYMPYESEYDFIVELANSYESGDKWKYRFITERSISELPFLPNNGYYKDLNIFTFEIPKEDIELITSRIIEAGVLIKKVCTLEVPVFTLLKRKYNKLKP